MIPLLAGLAVAGYLLGSVPFGLLITRAAGVGDIRRIGSGNIGATNVLRTGRKGLAAATLLLDAGKGAAAVLIGVYLAGKVGAGETGALVGGVAAVLGHMFPVWLGFRGGKGVATGLGVLAAASPVAALVCCAVWLGVAWAVRMSSAASLAVCAVAPAVVALVTGAAPLVALAVIVAVLVAARHHANIRRLLAGTEPRIGQK